MSDAQAAKGVATHSSGNHALSLSYRPGRRGIPLPMSFHAPRTAPEAKKPRGVRLGGIINRMRGPQPPRAKAVFAEVARGPPGSAFRCIPYNGLHSVDRGPGDLFARMLDQVEGPGRGEFAPIGGGRHGVRAACLTLSPPRAERVETYAAEPEQADDAYRSFKAAHIIADRCARDHSQTG